MNAFDILTERGFIDQMTHEREIRELMGKERVTCYIGYDPTANSLTIGGLLTVMALCHLQRAGHRPIILMGGGTGMVGDPTDKTEMRPMMTKEEISRNVAGIRRQMEGLLDFSDDKAIMADNADWLMKLEYIKLLREYGVHFSVNRMLTADAYKIRFERNQGLTFFELNYMVMQAYDFLELNRRYGCTLQLGGRDQWSNIIAGMELIRKVDKKEAYGMTFQLLTRADGEKMGKSMSGAVWLDPEKTSPYDFYQYFRNLPDTAVNQYLKLMTFLPLDEISSLMSGNINDAKKVLAFEVTKQVHGREAAEGAREAAAALFGGGGDDVGMPSMALPTAEFSQGYELPALLQTLGLTPSRSESRRLITQGGLLLNNEKITDPEYKVTEKDFPNGTLLIKKGKKTYFKVTLS